MKNSTRSTRNIIIFLNEKDQIDPDLHIKVTVVKSRLNIPSSALIDIYGISEETWIKLVSEPRITIKDGKDLLFTGKVLNAPNEKNGTDWLCTVYCNDVKDKPYQEPKLLDIPKGTSNKDILNNLVSTISEVKVDLSAFKECAKANGSLMKQMTVEYKKEEDIMKSLQNMFKGCDTEAIKEDGVVKLHHKNSVPNINSPLLFDTFLRSPTLSHKDLIIDIPLDPKVKLGLGFKIKAKSIIKKLDSPFTYKNQFKNKVFRISVITHELDNYTTAVATTKIKGLNLG